MNLFEAIGLINETIGISNIDIVYDIAANTIATLVADGICRISVQYQSGNPAIVASYIGLQDCLCFFSGNHDNPSYT